MKRDRPDLAINVCAHAIRTGHTRFFEDRFQILKEQGYQPYRPVKIKAAE
jgi:hypothetical protein